jgi:dihydroflavonol-4-reductase
VSRLALVTGATGFAGSHAMDALLAAGWRVRVPVRPTSDTRWLPVRDEVERVAAELCDPGSLRGLVAGATWVFHFGGVTRAPRPGGYFRVNTEGTNALWQAARAAGVECFLFCSSLAAGGPALSADRPRREDDPPAPITAYGRSKLEAERRLAGDGPRVIVVRPPAIYGPRDSAILVFFRWARRGILPLPPARDALLSLVHGRELAQACRFLAESGARGIFNVSDGGLYAWEDVGAAASRVLGRRLRPLRVPATVARALGYAGERLGRTTGAMPVLNADKVRDIRQPYWTCDITRLRAAGYQPSIGLAAGIRETIEWYEREGWW